MELTIDELNELKEEMEIKKNNFILIIKYMMKGIKAYQLFFEDLTPEQIDKLIVQIKKDKRLMNLNDKIDTLALEDDEIGEDLISKEECQVIVELLFYTKIITEEQFALMKARTEKNNTLGTVTNQSQEEEEINTSRKEEIEKNRQRRKKDKAAGKALARIKRQQQVNNGRCIKPVV